MENLWREFGILKCTVLEVLQLDEGAVNLEGYAYKVVRFPSMFNDGLRLPLCIPIHDVLDMVSMAPA